jgi:mannose/fructose/N-acetylgalactosamine-specific phosphotransferase system component IID
LGIAAYFLMFNAPRLYFQYRGLIEGYRHGADIVKHIPIKLIEKYIQWLLLGGVFLLGMFINLEAKKAVQYGWESLLLFLIGAVSAFWLSFHNILKGWKWYLPIGITILFAFILSIF